MRRMTRIAATMSPTFHGQRLTFRSALKVILSRLLPRSLPAQVRAVYRRFGGLRDGAELPVLRAARRPAPFGIDRRS